MIQWRDVDAQSIANLLHDLAVTADGGSGAIDAGLWSPSYLVVTGTVLKPGATVIITTTTGMQVVDACRSSRTSPPDPTSTP
jgi:hypothetical protein